MVIWPYFVTWSTVLPAACLAANQHRLLWRRAARAKWPARSIPTEGRLVVLSHPVASSLRWPLLLLAVSLVWFLSGAPLAPGDWAEVPAHWSRLMMLLPRRMGLIYLHWLG